MLALHHKRPLPEREQAAADLIKQARQDRRIADVIRAQIRANNLATDEIKTEVQLAPRAPFAFGFMLSLKPSARTEYLQAGTVNEKVDRVLLVRPWARLQYQAIALARQGREVRDCNLPTRSKAAMERTRPWVWRIGCLKTMPRVRQSSIAISE